MSKVWHVAAAAILLLQLWVVPAAAEVMSLAGKAVTIEPIPGYCALDRTRDLERQAFGSAEAAVKADSKLLGYWIDCQALEEFRSKGSYRPVPSILVMAAIKNDRLFETNLHRQEVLNLLQTQMTAAYGGEQFLVDANDQTRQRLNEAIGAFSASGQAGARKVIGMMVRDTDAVYSASIQRTTIGQEESLLAGVTGTTVIKQFLLSAVAYDQYADEQTFLTLKDRAGTAVRALIAANRTGE